MTDRELVDLAFTMREKAYVPYSKFPVGAALMCADGTVFTGCNVENAAYGSTICAERTAVVKAVTYGRRDDWKVLAIAGGEEYCWPCGACRQMLYEFCPELTVLVARGDREFVKVTLDELLPHGFGPKSLKTGKESSSASEAVSSADKTAWAADVSAVETKRPANVSAEEKGHFVLPANFSDDFILPENDPTLQQFAKFFQDDFYVEGF